MFTKNDLKDGMVVETRDSVRYIVVGNRLIGNNGFLILADYDDDLCDMDGYDEKEGRSPYDIMMVFDVVNDLQVNGAVGKPLFERKSIKESFKSNESKAKDFCKELANIYDLDESKLYNYFLRLLHVIFNNNFSVVDFDIEKCSEADINEARRAISRDCATFYIIKNMEKD